MKLLTKLTLYTLFLGIAFSACDESDKFSSNPNLKLEYSRDTVAFGTVFTTLPSPTQEMKIYNRNNNSISFESIELMNPEKSGFRINVNGQGGSKFEGVDLLRKDSLYLIVDVKLHELKETESLVRDSIRLVWNGNAKYIQLGAHGIDVEIWDNKTISTDTHLSADKGYYIRQSLTVNEGARLSIEEGATFYLDKKASIAINGTIEASATIEKPITFRGHRFDFIERDILYDNASDQWVGITVGEKSFNNVLNNVIVRNSQVGINFLKSTPSQKKATLTNTIVHNTSNFGIKAINCDIDAVNCQITNSRGSLVDLIGGSYSFLHCTIANYYTWHSRTTPSVSLLDVLSGANIPLTKAEFTNCIVVGSFYDELSALVSNTSSFLFKNCVIQATKESNEPQYPKGNIWNIGTPFLFKDLNATQQYFYDFQLIENSTAINTANLSSAQDASADLKGRSRLDDGKPDIGCYEWFR